MALFLRNICTFEACGKKFTILDDLIRHIEQTHINHDPKTVAQKELSRPACLPLSYVLPFTREDVQTEIAPNAHNRNVKQKSKDVNKHHQSMPSSHRSHTTTEADIDDKVMVVSESEDSNDSWTAKYSTGFIMRYGSKHSGSGNSGTQTYQKPYACPVPGCTKRYKNVNGIKYHSKYGHKKDGKVRKPYKCHCGKNYKTAHGLKKHSTIVHSAQQLTENSAETLKSNGSNDLIIDTNASSLKTTTLNSALLQQLTNSPITSTNTSNVDNNAIIIRSPTASINETDSNYLPTNAANGNETNDADIMPITMNDDNASQQRQEPIVDYISVSNQNNFEIISKATTDHIDVVEVSPPKLRKFQNQKKMMLTFTQYKPIIIEQQQHNRAPLESIESNSEQQLNKNRLSLEQGNTNNPSANLPDDKSVQQPILISGSTPIILISSQEQSTNDTLTTVSSNSIESAPVRISKIYIPTAEPGGSNLNNQINQVTIPQQQQQQQQTKNIPNVTIISTNQQARRVSNLELQAQQQQQQQQHLSLRQSGLRPGTDSGTYLPKDCQLPETGTSQNRLQQQQQQQQHSNIPKLAQILIHSNNPNSNFKSNNLILTKSGILLRRIGGNMYQRIPISSVGNIQNFAEIGATKMTAMVEPSGLVKSPTTQTQEQQTLISAVTPNTQSNLNNLPTVILKQRSEQQAQTTAATTQSQFQRKLIAHPLQQRRPQPLIIQHKPTTQRLDTSTTSNESNQNVQQQQPPQQIKHRQVISISSENVYKAYEIFRKANRVTGSDINLILGFMAGVRENPRPNSDNVILIKLGDSEEHIKQEDGTSTLCSVESFIRLDYNSGEWKAFQHYRRLQQNMTATAEIGDQKSQNEN